MTENRLKELFNLYLNRQTTDAENKELWEAWKEQDPVLNAVKERLVEEAFDALPVTYQPTPLQSEDIFNRVMDDLNSVNEKNGEDEQLKKARYAPILLLRQRWWMAASVLLLLFIGGYWGLKRKKQQDASLENVLATRIIPGKNGAVLTLADGSQVLLDTIVNATVALQGGVTARVVNGALLYEGRGDAVVYNTMSTPKGRQFRITLPDGSQVWLNAASSIRFPTVFTGGERMVEISGEVYFEISGNEKMPFRVKLGDRSEVEVLGTSFNVNAYDDEPLIRTTLLDGAVRVQSKSKNSVVLKPGQQAQITGNTAEGKITVMNNVEMNKVIAWKNGFFDFEGVSFEVAMRQLERWFEIDVEYENNKVPDIEFIGKITRDVSFHGLLTGLKKMGVHYRLEGRKLIILSSPSQ